jgi:hypothetical protein
MNYQSTPIELSGLCYHGGKYTADYWKNLTGYDPKDYPGYFYVYPKSGYVMAERAYRDFCAAYFSRTRANQYALGIRA